MSGFERETVEGYDPFAHAGIIAHSDGGHGIITDAPKFLKSVASDQRIPIALATRQRLRFIDMQIASEGRDPANVLTSATKMGYQKGLAVLKLTDAEIKQIEELEAQEFAPRDF